MVPFTGGGNKEIKQKTTSNDQDMFGKTFVAYDLKKNPLSVGEIRQPWGITTQFSDTTLRFPGLIPDKSGLVQTVYMTVPDNYVALAN